jgi:hypothetical protein
MTYKLLLVHDVEVQLPDGTVLRWAYSNRTHALKKYAPECWHVDRVHNDGLHLIDVNEYDLVFMLDYMAMSYQGNLRNRRDGCILVTSFNKDSRSRQNYWNKMPGIADWVIVNNYNRWHCNGHPKANTCNISNGIDTQQWYNTIPIEQRDHIVGWCGSTGKRKGKRYESVLKPLQARLEQEGFQCSFRPINSITPDVVYPPDKQREWYNQCSYLICASESEGTPSFLLEGAACGCVPITTDCGNAREWINHEVNGMLIRPDINEIVRKRKFVRENRELMSNNVEEKMQGWAYGSPGNRAEWFYTLFQRLIEDGPHSVKPFSWMNSSVAEI